MNTQCTSTTIRSTRTLCLLVLTFLFLLTINSLSAQDQARTLSGIVKSTDGPVLGATITLKGTYTSTVSDEEGKFTFPAALKDDDVLVVEYLGYETDQVTINQNTTFVNSYLEDIPVVIVAALRTAPSTQAVVKDEN